METYIVEKQPKNVQVSLRLKLQANKSWNKTYTLYIWKATNR